MRHWLFALVVAMFAAGPAAAADPPVTFQTLPVGRVLNDARAVVGTVLGEKEAGSINEGIKSKLGPKGFTGFDLNRPLLGYVHLPADPLKATGVLVVPVTGEEAFLGFFERLTGVAPKAGEGGLYTVPLRDPDFVVGLRFAEGHAYVATWLKVGGGPAEVLAKDQLVPTAKLYDPADQSLLAVKVHFDRVPPEFRAKVGELLTEAKKAAGMLPIPEEAVSPPEQAIRKSIALGERWLRLSTGAKELTFRATLDPQAAELGAELVVVPRPGSELGKLVADRRPTANRFAGLLTPDTATGFVTRLPLFNDEIRSAATEGLESARKSLGGVGGPGGDLLQEVLKGAVRTVKTGEFDVAGAFRGPDKQGHFTGVLAVAFEDPTGVEKALKALYEAEAPPEFRRAINWDAEKVGGVSVHVLDLGKLPEKEAGFLTGPELKVVGGRQAKAALAFAPKATYLAVGPDAVGAVKGMLALRPGEAPVVTAVLNPSRWVKFLTEVDAAPREVAEFTKIFGADDRAITLGSLAVTGGGELRATARLSLRAVISTLGSRAAATAPAPPP